MITQNKRIESLCFHFTKKSIKESFSVLFQAPNGYVLDLNRSLKRISQIQSKEIEFFVRYCEHNNILEISGSEYRFSSSQKLKKLLNDLSEYYFNLLFSDPDIFENVFEKSSLSLENDYLIIDTNSIEMEYRQIISSLARIGFIEYTGNQAYIQNFLFAKKMLDRPLRKLKKSQEQYEIDLAQQSERGKLAEQFVLEQEIKKLEETKYTPIRKSIEDVGLGYDIESYKLNGEKIYIEVKSLKQNSFFWSENEINASKKHKGKYFIFCVKFKDGRPDHISKTIRNPHYEIFEEGNFKKIQSGDYRIYLNKDQ